MVGFGDEPLGGLPAEAPEGRLAARSRLHLTGARRRRRRRARTGRWVGQRGSVVGDRIWGESRALFFVLVYLGIDVGFDQMCQDKVGRG